MLVSLRACCRKRFENSLFPVAWTDADISVHFFPRGSIPDDIIANAPLPDTWGQAMARWPSTNCDFSKYFLNHSIIIDTTLWYAYSHLCFLNETKTSHIQWTMGRRSMDRFGRGGASDQLCGADWVCYVSGVRPE